MHTWAGFAAGQLVADCLEEPVRPWIHIALGRALVSSLKLLYAQVRVPSSMWVQADMID